jgi:hypothetical protein
MPTTLFDMFWTSRAGDDDHYLLEERDATHGPRQAGMDHMQPEESNDSDTTLDSPTTPTTIHAYSDEIATSYLDAPRPSSMMPRSSTPPPLPHGHYFDFYNNHATYSEGDLFPRLDEASYRPDAQRSLHIHIGGSTELVDGPFPGPRYSHSSSWPIPTDRGLVFPPVLVGTEENIDLRGENSQSSFYSKGNNSVLACPVNASEQPAAYSNYVNIRRRRRRDLIPAPLLISPDQEVGMDRTQRTWLSLPPKEPKTRRAASPLWLHKSSAYPSILVQPGTPSSITFPQTIFDHTDSTGRIKSSAAVIEYANPLCPPLIRPALASYPLLRHEGSVRRARSPSFPVGIGASLSSSSPYLLREPPYYYGSASRYSVRDMSSVSIIHDFNNDDETILQSHFPDTITPQARQSALLTYRANCRNDGASAQSLPQSLHNKFDNLTNASIAVPALTSRLSTQNIPASLAERTSFAIDDASIKDNNENYIGGLPLVGKIACLWLGNFLVVLLASMIPVAAPRISTQLNGMRDIGLYSSSYFLLLAAFLPTFRKIYHLFSSKKIYLVSLLIFEGLS